jgi:hypothetical protein
MARTKTSKIAKAARTPDPPGSCTLEFSVQDVSGASPHCGVKVSRPGTTAIWGPNEVHPGPHRDLMPCGETWILTLFADFSAAGQARVIIVTTNPNGQVSRRDEPIGTAQKDVVTRSFVVSCIC